MKKYVVLVSVFLMFIILCSCGKSTQENGTQQSSENVNNATVSANEISGGKVYDSTEAFTYELYDDGIIITEFKNYDFVEYDSIIIPKEIDGHSVIGIGSEEKSYYVMGAVFGNCEIVIPDTVRFIGIEAFTGCDGVTKISGGEGVRRICDYAFMNCVNLKEISFLNSVDSIAENAFVGCTAWEESHS